MFAAVKYNWNEIYTFGGQTSNGATDEVYELKLVGEKLFCCQFSI